MGSNKKRGVDRSDLSDKSDWLGFSEGNGVIRKRREGVFDEKRL
ncbi:hypothetical protein HMPREF9078_02484 [Capnocytophaga sp. oral taxon 380 str. F0488]|nr:hypothetical protein HMPREF9078_02484 [Capnocytophaga sp. oral taxon 380 str. F0488]